MSILPIRFCGASCVVFSLALAIIAAAGCGKASREGEAVFAMREVSAFGKNDIAPGEVIARGTYAECSDEPDKQVKAYPKLTSKHPLYGKLTFDRDFFTASGVEFHFVLDESGEAPTVEEESQKPAETVRPSLWRRFVQLFTGDAGKSEPAAKPLASEPKRSTYDRLYVDLNRDLDLTNDRMLKPMETPPPNSLPPWQMKERMAFEYLDVDVDCGRGLGVRPFRIFPWLYGSARDGGSVKNYMYFAAPTARQGRIRLGQHVYDALLAQPQVVTGRFDRPWTSLFLKPVGSAPNIVYSGLAEGRLRSAHWVDGVLYTTTATPLGDKLIVKPYRGDFGVIRMGAGGRNTREMGLQGSLDSKTMIVSVTAARQTLPKDHQEFMQGFVKEYDVPVGEYYPPYLTIQYGRLRIDLSDNYHAEGQPRSRTGIAQNCFIKIRKDRPFVLDFANKPQVLFASPAKNKTFKPGDEIEVKAVLIDPACDFMIRNLFDSSRKEKKTDKLAGGKEHSYERDLSLDPIVTVTDSNGKKVAEGPMPFG
jgi:hypothetical protein